MNDCVCLPRCQTKTSPPSNPSEVNVKMLFQTQHAAGEATMDDSGLLKVGGRNNKNKLKSAGRTLRVPALTEEDGR